MSSQFYVALSLFFFLNLFIEFGSGCCCCDCCCCCNQQQTMDINGTTIPMGGGGCGCGGGGSDALLALLLGRRRRRNANLVNANILQRTNALQKEKSDAGGGGKCLNCEGQKGCLPEKSKPKQFFSIPAPNAERELHQQHHHQPANPLFFSVPHSQLKIKRQK